MKKTFTVTTQKIFNASIINLIYFSISSFSLFILTPLTLKALGDEKYGIWVMLLSIIQFSSLSNMGMSNSMLVFVPKYCDTDNESLSVFITFTYLFVTFTSILAIFTIILLNTVFIQQLKLINLNKGDVQLTINFVAISILPLILGGVSKNVLNGLVKNEYAGGLETGQNLCLWFGTLLIGIMNLSIKFIGYWVLIINVVYLFIASYIMWLHIRQYNIHFCLSKNKVMELLRFSTHNWFVTLGNLLFQTFDKIIVGFTLGPVAVGVYGIANSAATRILLVTSQITQTLIPYVSNQGGIDQKRQIKSVFKSSNLYIAWLISIGSLLLVIWLDIILNIWISVDFSSKNIIYFRILVIAYALISISRPAFYVLTGLGEVKFLARIQISCSILMLLGVWFFSINWGLFGAIIANLLETSIIVIIYFASKKLKMIKETFKDLFFPLILLSLSIPFTIFRFSIIFRFLFSWVAILLLVLVIRSKNGIVFNKLTSAIIKGIHHRT